MSFEDNFSRHAADYARHRPQYPRELFAFIASMAPDRTMAWDCGTGNGQAAVDLAEHFEQVIATDASAEQIAHATLHPRITYRVTPAEHTDIEPHSVDAVTVATAIHWFNLPDFYAEVERVAKPGCVIAAWSYFGHAIGEEIDEITRRLAHDIVGPYWSQKLRAVSGSYEALPFPFEEIKAPPFSIEAEWDMSSYLGYLGSWSATQKFKETKGYDPIDEIRDDLAAAWGDPETPRLIQWPLHLRVGRVRKG